MTDLTPLFDGELHPFADPVRQVVPPNVIGVYTVWRGAEFLYVGIGGTRVGSVPAAKNLPGLQGRLHSHRAGARSGNQFCIYVCDRLVLPGLEPSDLRAVGAGHLSLDVLTRDFIRRELAFRYAETTSVGEARVVEDLLRGGNWPLQRRPLLNPMPEGVLLQKGSPKP